MGDIQEEKGKTIVQEFQTEFGADAAYFCKVDVTKDADVQGKEALQCLKKKPGKEPDSMQCVTEQACIWRPILKSDILTLEKSRRTD